MDPVTRKVFDDIQEAAARVGLTVTPVSAEEFLEMGRRAMLRRGRRFHVTASATGHPVFSSWWVDEGAARERFRIQVGKWASRPGACVTLIDETERETLAVWPDET
jgi:hypothetical protein